MKKRKSYPLFYKWAYAKKRELELIPLRIRRSIPKQTKWQWKNQSPLQIDKLEEDEYLASIIDGIKTEEENNFRVSQQFLWAASKVQLETINMVGEPRYHKILSVNKESFVRMIEQYSEIIDRAILLKWFKISTKKFEVWQSQINYDCTSSVISLCARKHTNQTTREEFSIIVKGLKDPDYSHWPKSSIYS